MAENAALHAQLLVQAREAGVADERRRLAAEIHDTIAQGLTGIIAQLQVVTSVTDRDPETARVHLERAAALARHSLGEARRSVHNLAPVALEHDELPERPGEDGRHLGRTAPRTGRVHRHRHRRTRARRGRGHPPAHRAGGPGQRGPPRRGLPGRRHALLHGRRGDPGRPGRRPRLRPGAPPHRPTAPAASASAACGPAPNASRARWTVESEPGGGTAVSARVPLVSHA